MNFKEIFEKDPMRCRVLRQNERQIEIDAQKANATFTKAMNEIKKLRGKRGQLKDREKNITVAIAGATLASGMRGARGHVMGGGASSITTQREVVRSQIHALERQITQVQTTIEISDADRTRLARALKQNADELGLLNCVA